MLCRKRQGNYVVCNKLPSGTVGWIVARGTVSFWEFCSLNPEGSPFFPSSKLPSLVFFARVSLNVRAGVRVRLRFRFRFRF